MSEQQSTHLLGVGIDRWNASEYVEPGRDAPLDRTWEHDRGTVADCDLIAANHGAPDLSWENPQTPDYPMHDRTYHRITADGQATEVWCRGRAFAVLGRSEWAAELPTVADVFNAKNHEGKP